MSLHLITRRVRRTLAGQRFGVLVGRVSVILIMLLISALGGSEGEGQGGALLGDEAADYMAGANYVKLNEMGELPTRIYFDDDVKISKQTFFTIYESAFQLSGNSFMQEIRSDADKGGRLHTRFQQYYQGLRIIGAEYILHEAEGAVYSANGKSCPSLNLSVTPALSENAALSWAANQLGMSPSNTSASPAELAISAPSYKLANARDLRLVYVFELFTPDSSEAVLAEVDANTGDIVNSYRLVHEADVTATGITRYDGLVGMTVESFAQGHRLRESEDRNIETGKRFVDQGPPPHVAFRIVEDRDGDAHFDSLSQRDGVSVHWGMEHSHDYAVQRFGSLVWDGNNGVIRSIVESDRLGSTPNAGFFPDTESWEFGPLTVSLDIVAHEFMHGVVWSAFNHASPNMDEPGALNESFSDIFGAMVEFEKSPGGGDWTIAEDVITPFFRSMSNPNSPNWDGVRSPDTYMGTFWYTGPSQSAFTHRNNGVQNFWFYLLSEGGSGTNDHGLNYSVSAIGKASASAVAFHNLRFQLTSTSDYADARDGAIAAALNLYGHGSPEWQAVIEAWDAVGVEGDTGPPPPTLPAPTSLAATASNETTVVLSWNDNTSNELGFSIERRNSQQGAFAQIATVSANTTTYDDNGLTENTTYEYRVRAFKFFIHVNDVVYSSYSNIASVTTPSGQPPTPDAPTNLVVTNVSTNFVSLGWQHNGLNLTHFRILRTTDPGCNGLVSINSSVPGNQRSYVDHTASPNTSYCYRIRALNGTTPSSLSNSVTITTPMPVLLAAPTNFTVTHDAATDSVRFAWTDNSVNEEGFAFRFKITGTAQWNPFNLTAGANEESYVWANSFPAGLNYDFQTRAFAGYLVSDWSNIATEFIPPAQSAAIVGEKLSLSVSAYPNPFNPSTTLHYSIPGDGRVSLTIYDTLGKKIRTLVDGLENAGSKSVAWRGRNDFGQDVGSGVYFYRLAFDGQVLSKKVLLIK